MRVLDVCETCLEWAAEEGLAAAEECELICLEIGDMIADHLCEEIETAGSTPCGCACHGAKKRRLRERATA